MQEKIMRHAPMQKNANRKKGFLGIVDLLLAYVNRWLGSNYQITKKIPKR